MSEGDDAILPVRARGRSPTTSERLYVVAYDITDQRRWRRVFQP